MNISTRPTNASKCVKLSFAACALAILMPGIASAQMLLEEIVVTAQKRAQDIQDVPISIAAMGENDIARFGIDDVLDLRGTVPGLEVRRSLALGNPTFTIRGVGSTNFDTITGPVVVPYVDDVPLTSVGQLNFTTFDLAGIEVLKGPQGTLFGSGTTGGVVHFKTKRPTDTFESYVKAEAGEFGLFSLEGAVSGPLSEGLSGRLSARTETFDGYYTNTLTGGDTGGLDAFQIRGQLLWETDSGSVLVGMRAADSDGQSALYSLVPLLADDGTGTAVTCPIIAAGIARGGVTEADIAAARTGCVDVFGLSQTADPYDNPSDNIYDPSNGVDLTTWGFNVRADFDIGDNVFTSITGVDLTEHGGVDPEGPGRAGSADIFWVTDVIAFSQEMRLASGDDAQNPWIFGFNAMANTIENELLGQLNFPTFGAEGSTFITETPAETLAASIPYSAPQTQDTIEVGVFGQVDWQWTDQLVAVTGVRGQWYRKEGTVEAIGFFPRTETKLEEGGLSFNFGLNYDLNDSAMLYGKISQGIRSGSHAGGFIFGAASAPGAEQETLLSYEAGIKSQIGNGLQFNAAAFFYDYQDLQSLTQQLVGTTFVQRYSNIGDAEITGAEIDVSWAPSDALLFKVAASFLDTEVTSTNANIQTDFTGNDLSTSPDLQASWLARYTSQFGSGGYWFSFQYDGSFTDDQFRNIDNNPLGFDEATTYHNVVATLTSPYDKWEFSAWGRNLSDELDMTWQFSWGGLQKRSYLAPRTWGVNATFRWE